MYKIRIAAALLVASLALTGCMSTPSSSSSSSTTATPTTKTITKSGFTVTVEFEPTASRWDYIVRGEVPTPCHKLEAEAIVRESFPEQVTIQVSVKQPATGSVCAQVVTAQVAAGTFSASAGAKVDMSVK